MRLHAPEFEKALRRRVKQAVRSSPELKRESRRTKRARRPAWVRRVVFLWMTIPFGLLVQAVTLTTGDLTAGLAVINLGLLALVSVISHGLRTRLQTSPENLALACLPMPREKMFWWQWQQFWRQSLRWLPYVLAGFAALAWRGGFSPGQWAAALCIAVLAWAVLLAVAVVCTARLPPAPFQLATASLALLLLAVVFGRGLVAPAVLQALEAGGPELNLVLPTGWPVSLLQAFAGESSFWFLILLLPIGVVFWAARNSLDRLFDGFDFQEYVHAEPHDLVPEEVSAPGRVAIVGLTDIEEIIQSRQFLTVPEWASRGRLELRLWCWLSPREQVLADFAFPNGVAITAPWLRVFKIFGIAAVAAFAAGQISPVFRLWVLGAGLYFDFCILLGLIQMPGRAFQPLQFSGVNIPMYTGFAIGFGELSRLLFKCSIIQLPVLLAFGAAAGLATGVVFRHSAVLGLLFGVKAGFLVFGSRFILIAMSFSSGTDDTRRLRLRSLPLIGAFVLFGVAFVGLGGGGLFFPGQLIAWLLCLAAVADAYGFFLVYQWFYHHARFDLMSLPKS